MTPELTPQSSFPLPITKLPKSPHLEVQAEESELEPSEYQATSQGNMCVYIYRYVYVYTCTHVHMYTCVHAIITGFLNDSDLTATPSGRSRQSGE